MTLRHGHNVIKPFTSTINEFLYKAQECLYLESLNRVL
jgi:hypothetical protein